MDQSYAILLVEPSRYHSRLIERTLHNRCPECHVVAIQTARAAINELATRRFDIALIDYELQEFDGLELLQLIRRESIDLPVILLSDRSCEQAATEAINYGASDFLTKDDTYHLILPRVIHEALRRAALVRKNRELEEKLRTHDEADAIALTSATLAHEINNPLMTILGLTDLLSQHSALADQSSADKLQAIEESAQRIRRAVLKLTRAGETKVVETAGGLLLDPQKLATVD